MTSNSITAPVKYVQVTDMWGNAAWYSPDATDTDPHPGFCVACGAPAPLRRVYDARSHRLCYDTDACQQRVHEQDSAHLDREYALHFGGGEAA